MLYFQLLDEPVQRHERHHGALVHSPEASVQIVRDNQQGTLRILAVEREEALRVEARGAPFALDRDRVATWTCDDEIDFSLFLVAPVLDAASLQS